MTSSDIREGAPTLNEEEAVVFKAFPDPQGFVRTWNLLHGDNVIDGQFDQSKSMSSIRLADGLTRITYMTATHPKIAGASFSIHPRIHPFTGAMPPGTDEEMMSSAMYESCTHLFSLFVPTERSSELTEQIMSDVFAEQREVEAFGYNFYYNEGCWVSKKGTGIFRQEGQSNERAHATNELQSLKQEQDARIAAIRGMASSSAETVAPINANTVTSPKKVLSDGPAKILSAPPAKYPPAAARAGISGEVEVQIDLDGSGNVTNVSISKSSRNRDLDRSAMDAVRKWHFSPNILGGVGVAGRMRTTISFDVNSASAPVPSVESSTSAETAIADDTTDAAAEAD
ncbi:TonB family C-terminal domain-containing protein [Pseudoxanthomonas sp. CF125]|nr:TonB family C-terminal domain-containing protein [Pseudoxanthomonas sp. CF125]